MGSGQHQFLVTTSGTADTAISWTNALTIDSAGNIGMGESSPATKLVVKANTVTLPSLSVATTAVIAKSTQNELSIISGNSSYGMLNFGDTDDEDAGGIDYNHSTNTLRLNTNGTAGQIEINSAGTVTIANTTVMDSVLKIKERAAADSDSAGYGQLWVKNTTPCQLWFTDDAGTDTQIV
jgi:hypothetical protein